MPCRGSRRRKRDAMRVVIQEDYRKMCKWAADYIAARIKAHGEDRPFVLGLPTGSSPIGVYQELVRQNRAGELSFANVVTFNMDEYLGLPQEHDQSYWYFMHNNFFNHLTDMKPENINILNGMTDDPEGECARYEAKIASYGGIDLFLGGIGVDGHIAFNEPYTSLASRTGVRDLTTDTRIVSIDQPHVRPIVRGKAGCPTEFGAKVIVGLVSGYAFLMKADWNNYSESRSLKQVVEEYKETFGFYPKTILADRAYPGRENRLWCTSLGIRLSGPRLGRKSAEEKQAESKQIYQDGCDRVVIEGTFGVVKRRYSLDRVMTRLPDTSMTSIAMGFFAANMERKLRLLFTPEYGWALDYDFDLGELVIFPRFPDVPAIQ